MRTVRAPREMALDFLLDLDMPGQWLNPRMLEGVELRPDLAGQLHRPDMVRLLRETQLAARMTTHGSSLTLGAGAAPQQKPGLSKAQRA